MFQDTVWSRGSFGPDARSGLQVRILRRANKTNIHVQQIIHPTISKSHGLELTQEYMRRAIVHPLTCMAEREREREREREIFSKRTSEKPMCPQTYTEGLPEQGGNLTNYSR
jgi:hypothetical protein